MSLRAHLRIGEEPVEQSESPRQRPVIRRRVGSEEQQAAVAVAFLEVAKDLIVGPVFLDDVDHVLEGRVAPGSAFPPAVRRGDAAREGAKLLGAPPCGQHAERSAELAESVAERTLNPLARNGSVGVGARAAALSAYHQQPLFFA